MNLPLTASPPLPDNPPASETYPPTFSQVTLELARDLLHRLIPELDVQTTSLSYRDSQAASDDGNLINAPLIPSLVEYFTGHLNWAHSDVQGLYPSPSSTSQTPAIPLLDGAATTLFYNQINQQLEPFYRQKLADYWSAATDGGDTRRSQFIAEQIECLKSECVVLIALEKMTTNHYSLLSQALRPCDTSLAANIADIQAHSVYSLSARTGEGPPVSLYGAFVIARRLRDEPVRIDEEEREDVLLFTPHEGLQAFASLKQLHETLVKRGSVLEYGQSLGTEQVNQIDSNASELHWQYTLMEGDFLSLLHAGLVVRQQSIFAQAVQLARAQRMDEICFEQSLTHLPGSDVYFDNHWRLDRLDADLIQSQMPEWWKTMTPSQHQEWLDQAQRFGESIVSIRQASKDNFDQPENDSRTYLTRYIDKQLDDMLKRSSIPTAAERITLSMTYRVGTEVQEITGAPVPPATSTLQVSLRQLAHDRAHRILVEDALVVRAVDDTGAVITRLEKSAIKALVEAIEDPQHLSDYLDLHLRTSAYAQQLKKLQKAMLEAQMKMALLELEQQAFAPLGREWIKAVLDSPAPQGRPTVNGEAIEVRFFSVNQFKMTNVMLIAPAGKFEKGPLVLCTLDASDGVVFRWFNSMYHLTTRFLEERPFQQYLIQQIPVSRRLETLNAMQYEKEAKHWRPPEVFTQLTLLPIPSRLLHPVVFVSQSKDIYEENHETKINHLINEAKRQMSQATGRGQSARGFDLLAGIAILFLPDPIMLPVSLGVGLYKTWSAFSKVDENDLEGAAEEFLSAIS
ncbi:dermonecrotic toxin domain-containing protein, partial [Pseudomonas syringae]